MEQKGSFQESDCYLIEVGYWINKENKQFFRNRYLPHGFSVPIIRKERKNRGIFTTAYRYNTANPDGAALYGDLYFDFDDGNDFENVKDDSLTALAYLKTVFKIEYDQVYIYFSGKKGVHIIVPASILGAEPRSDMNIIYKAIATKIKTFTRNDTLDMAVYDNKRMFRVPYSIHEDTGLYKVELSHEELRTLSYDEIAEIASSPRKLNIKHSTAPSPFSKKQYEWFIDNYPEVLDIKMKESSYEGALRTIPPCIQSLMDEGAAEGGRNNCAAVMASFYRNYGKTYEESLELVGEWNDEKNVPPLHPREVEHTVQSIFRGNASYGCSTIKNVAKCDAENCILKRGKMNDRKN